MLYDVAPGDVLHIGETVKLTVLAVEGDAIRFGLEALGPEPPKPTPNWRQPGPKHGWWEDK
jgi:hypothetical protein